MIGKFFGRQRLVFVVLVACPLVAGCAENAGDFFSGRPSGMAMVHNRIIAGPPQAMADLLRVPSRFPDATGVHVADWQASLTTWWRNPEKHAVMMAMFRELSAEESLALRNWVRITGDAASQERRRVLQEIEAALHSIPGPSR